MYVTDEMLAGLVAKYGQPKEKTFEIATSRPEFDRIKGSQKHGRNHDFTLYVMKGKEVIVIAKPFYPAGMYRAPSGGLNPGEDAEIGMAREAIEETGCQITLSRFLLTTNVSFVCESDVIKWRSFVFRAEYSGGDFEWTDKREISEVRLARLDEFAGFSEIMRSTDIGGLHYRAALHDDVMAVW